MLGVAQITVITNRGDLYKDPHYDRKPSTGTRIGNVIANLDKYLSKGYLENLPHPCSCSGGSASLGLLMA